MPRALSPLRPLPCLLAALALSACGGDDDGPGPVDAGGDTATVDAGPPGCPLEDPALMGPCCYRVSNADRLANPEFRVAGVSLERPGSLSNPLVRTALNTALEDELFNWLIQIEGAAADGPVTITTGYGQVNETTRTFSFVDGAAPSPGDPDRWNPVTDMGTLSGEVITTELLEGSLTIPVFEEDGVTLSLELPLSNLELVNLEMSEDRSCVGDRGRLVYDTMSGTIRTFVPVAATLDGQLVLPPIETQLCNFIRGDANYEGSCEEVDQSEWSVKPDAICDETGGNCRPAGDANENCDPDTTCNAWEVFGGFAAHGIEIE